MDYTRALLSNRLKKVIRYSGLYGINRTNEKVRGQYHIKAKGLPLRERLQNPDAAQGGNIGLLGSSHGLGWLNGCVITII
jgi:hypothetical protein